MDQPVIIADRLTRHFDGIRAVDELSFEVPRGSLFGYLGPNGAGKTTTIRLLLGLLEPSTGSASVLGMPVATEAAGIREKVGALLEHTGLYETLTATENLEFVGRVWGMSAKERSIRIQETLEEMGLWDRRDEPVGKWSRGMRQRLALARALIHRPELVLLDEPTAGLDVVAASEVRDAMRIMTEVERVTIFLTTHNLFEAERLCDQIGVIREGRLIAIDHPDALRHSHGPSSVTISASGLTDAMIAKVETLEGVSSVSSGPSQLTVNFENVVDASPVVNVLVFGGASVHEVIPERASLEEVFLSLVNSQGDYDA